MSSYFKNTELAARYSISESTVRNWVKTAKEGKLKLELSEHRNRVYVTNSNFNISIIEGLVKHNRKYRNSNSMKTVTPSKELFGVFNRDRVSDIIRNLELHHEIPRQYGYFREGVHEWEEYVNQQLTAGTPNMLTRTVELLADNYGYIDKHFARFEKVNVIDIGVGDASPVKELLTRLIEQNRLGRYIALDFSRDMLNLAERRLKEWFGNRIKFEGYELDISHERFANLITEDYLRFEQDRANLVLFLGSTPANLRVPSDAFRTICESMGAEDLLVYTDKLAPEGALPEWFEYQVKRKDLEKPEVTRQHRLVFDLLGIRESYYDVEIGFDERSGQRYARVRLKVSINLIFDFEKTRRALVFEKGDAIILWRCWQATPRSVVELHEKNGFYVTHSSQSQDHEYILTIAEIKRDV
jgi:SAM-dependent methyltransferase